MKLYLATSNKGKVAELIPLVREFFPQFEEIIARAPLVAEEIEDTFLGNSKIKCVALMEEIKAEKKKALLLCFLMTRALRWQLLIMHLECIQLVTLGNMETQNLILRSFFMT